MYDDMSELLTTEPVEALLKNKVNNCDLFQWVVQWRK